MRSAAFIKAERARLNRRPATPTQRHRLAELSKQVGIEVPRVYWSCDAVDAIKRLEGMLRQPQLEGFRA